MMYGFLLLGLLPLIFMSDLFDGSAEAETEEEDDIALDDNSGILSDMASSSGDFTDLFGDENRGATAPQIDPAPQTDPELDPGTDPDPEVDPDLAPPPPPVAEMPDVAAQSDDPDDPDNEVLKPVEDDDQPPEDPNPPVDPDDVLKPDDSDGEPPAEPGEEPDNVLAPLDETGEDLPQDGTLVEQGVMRDGDATAGLPEFEYFVDDTQDQVGTDGADDISLEDDGLDGTGEGELSDWHGTPLVKTPGDLNVVDGGAGDDVISTGDEAAYAFGGAGDDDITVGEGAAAVFGGDGEDVITGGDGDAAYLDGGAGDDVIQGGDADEIIKGGVHVDGTGESDDDVIDGGAGNDDISGGLGADDLSGGDGDDVIDHKGVVDEDSGAERDAFDDHVDNEADTLDGGAGDDTLVFDRADTATGGEGSDVFWLYFDEVSGTGHAEVTDFETGEDFLRVQLNPDLTHGDIIMDVHPSEDGMDGVVTVNGDVVAVLAGSPDATTADVYVEVREDVFR